VTIYRLWTRRSLSVGIVSIILLIACVTLLTFISVGAASTTNTSKRATALAQRYATERAPLPPYKQAYADIGATKEAAALLASPLPTRDTQATFPPVSTPSFVYGILNMHENPFRPSHAAVNEWFGTLNGKHVGVYATTLVEDVDRGAVGIATEQADGTDIYQEYPTATKHGALRIIAVNDVLFTLQAKDGTVFTFDLATRTFV
jgi:hypothetical protein